MLTKVAEKRFENGVVYALRTEDGYLIETTDTFLPYYTKDAIGRKQNFLDNNDLGSRADRWMIGVSTMSGCCVGCQFCATGNMKKFRNLTADEIVEQVEFILSQNKQDPLQSKEFKINYTRMGEPFLNIKNVREAISRLDKYNPHHYVSTIGVSGSDFSWIKDNITLQISLHSLDDERRNNLIPFKKKLTIKELGQIRTKSNLKTTVNMTLVDTADFDIEKLKQYFDPQYFFIKLSPINENCVSKKNHMGKGIIEGVNIV
jgi:23S rRNA (adenine2503-C2)-methyltransferase